jgi:hypothetical protein
MTDLKSIGFSLAGIPMVATYRVYLDDDIRYGMAAEIEIDSVVVQGTDIKVDLDYPINRDTVGAHIDSIIFEYEKDMAREAAQ